MINISSRISTSIFVAILAMFVVASTAESKGPKDSCATIHDGTILTNEGDIIPNGYIKEGDREGYNYQAHLYNGDYGYPGWSLVMKWNDSWLSNKDCDNDGKLDRPLDESGNQYYDDSGAWLTNHWSTEYTEDGQLCQYDYFSKIVAVTTDSYSDSGVWYTSEGLEIGPVIWVQFATIQEQEYDTCYPESVYSYKGTNPGLGNRGLQVPEPHQ